MNAKALHEPWIQDPSYKRKALQESTHLRKVPGQRPGQETALSVISLGPRMASGREVRQGTNTMGWICGT